MSASPAGAVAYVAYTFPVLTQTFTVREVAALRRRGVEVEVFAVRRDPSARLDPEAQDEGRRATYLRGPFSLTGAGALLSWLIRRPLRFASTLVTCLGGTYTDHALACRLRAPLQFALGVELAAILRRRRQPVQRVHAQFVDAGSTVAYTAARLTETPFSFMNHTAYNPFLLPAKAATADFVLSISEADRERVVAACGESVRDRVRVQHVGITLQDWDGLQRAPRDGTVLIVGGLREKKGHAVLLSAAAILAEQGVPIEVRIAGGGALEAALRRQATELGVRVEFLGAVGPAQVAQELSTAAAFCLPCVVAANGDLDGIPVALMEAMAAGVPVVSTRLSGVPELIEDRISGRLAEPGDPASLAEALAAVLSDPEVARRLAFGGRARVAERHDLERTSAGLAAHLTGAAA